MGVFQIYDALEGVIGAAEFELSAPVYNADIVESGFDFEIIYSRIHITFNLFST